MLKEIISEAYSIEYTREGFKELGTLIKKIEDLVNREVIVGFESTGVYGKQLQKFLMDNRFDMSQLIHCFPHGIARILYVRLRQIKKTVQTSLKFTFKKNLVINFLKLMNYFI